MSKMKSSAHFDKESVTNLQSSEAKSLYENNLAHFGGADGRKLTASELTNTQSTYERPFNVPPLQNIGQR